MKKPVLKNYFFYPAVAIGIFSIAFSLLTNIPSLKVNMAWHAGFEHPLQGWDHIVTMLAVGIWAAQLRGHAIWMLPLAFVSVMSLGGIAGVAGLTIPSVEGLILLSCGVFSLLIIRKVRFSTHVNVLIVAFFAFFHGFAHGQEISTSASLLSYTLGFMLATLLLHGAGIIVTKLVILSVTCLVAIFFSSIAQASHPESAQTNKSIERIHSITFNPSSLFNEIERLENDGGYLKLTKHYLLYAEDAAKHSSAGSASSPPLKVNKLPVKIGMSSGKISAYDHLAGSTQDLTKSRAVFYGPEIIQTGPCLSFDFTNGILGSSSDFKDYFPDINHTPGKDLLSNGVGLTSPPIVAAHSAPSISLPISRKLSISTSEETALQILLVDSAFKTTSRQLANDYANRNTDNAVNIAPNTGHGKRYRLIYLVPRNPFNSLTGVAIAAGSGLDLVFVNKTKSRHEVAKVPPFSYQPNPLTIEKFYAQ